MRTHRLFTAFSTVLVSVSLSMAAGPGWVTLNDSPSPAPIGVVLEPSTAAVVTARVEVAGVLATSTNILGREFLSLDIPGAGLTSDVGRPRLPVARWWVRVPRGSAVGVRFEPTGQVDERTLESLGGRGPLAPVQPPEVKLPDQGARELAMDEDFYAADGTWPGERAAIVARGIERGRDLVLVEFRPLLYNPARGIVAIAAAGRLVVEARGGDACASRPPDSVALESTFHGEALNDGIAPPAPCAPPAPRASSSEGAEGMLVLVNDSFAGAIEPFADWKRKTGWKVLVKKLSEIGPAPTDSQIKGVIQDAYNSWADPTLGFVLMVGDTDFTPIHTGHGGGGNQVADLWYACLDGGDYLPDVAIARISTRNVSETQDVVDKLLLYERASFATTGWIKKAGFIGTADTGHIGQIEGTHDWCIDSFYTPNAFQPTAWSHGYASSDRHYYTYNADTSEIAASIDEGRMMVNYSGHGSQTSWQGPTSHGGYDQSDVRGNTNDQMYPFVISNACITGTLNATECFAETWQKAPHKGSIGFLGASNNSYWNEDDYFQRRLHTRMFPMDQTPALGIVVNRAKRDLYDHYGATGTVEYYFEMYNLLSEPSLSLWTRVPRTLDVGYDEPLPAGSTEFVVTVKRGGTAVAGDMVAVRKTDEGVFAAGYTDATGRAVLHLDPAPLLPGTMDVTVTGHDDRPYEDTVEVVPVEGPWLRSRAHRVEDAQSGCDADGLADIGETALFAVTVENIGGDAALDAVATLASTADLAVLNNPVALGTVAAGSAVEAVFEVRIGAGVSCMQSAAFTIALSCAGCTARQDGFHEVLETDHRSDTIDETMEHGGAEPAGWTHQALGGKDDWKIVAGQNHTPSGSYAYFATDAAGAQKDIVLLTPPLGPEGRASWSFWERHELTSGHSAAVLEFSTDGGANWQDLGPYVTKNPYTDWIGQGESRRPCWSGSSSGWQHTEADLTAFAGRTVRIRFRLAGAIASGTGWWIDDTQLLSVFEGCDLSACGIPCELAIASMSWANGAVQLAWGDDPVAASYRVERTYDPSATFEDVTALDDDATDTNFADPTPAPFACWLVRGVGPDGEGP
ncbi:MAG: choice-of-anchor J domain-containing protein [Acidobacteria bacterium]|nr:choice-of-anchor J domain-containing protein [Acidobacteriota bacterium]